MVPRGMAFAFKCSSGSRILRSHLFQVCFSMNICYCAQHSLAQACFLQLISLLVSCLLQYNTRVMGAHQISGIVKVIIIIIRAQLKLRRLRLRLALFSLDPEPPSPAVNI